MSKFKWVITRDLDAERYPDEASSVGKGNLKDSLWFIEEGEELLAELLPVELKLYDDDGILYFEGRATEGDSESAFRPLDWATGWAGCTEIKYKTKKGWETL